MNRHVAHCPVATCPWDYELTEPHTEHRGERLVAVIPPPEGVDPAVGLEGVLAAQQVMNRGAGSFDDVAPLLLEAANAQDDVVVKAHVLSHPREQLQAAFGDQADELFALLERTP